MGDAPAAVPRVSSDLSVGSIGQDGHGEDLFVEPGTIVVAEQSSRLQEYYECTLELFHRAAAVLLPLLKLSKYGLGVALILCVTVIWVASSEWIQYIFGTLEYDKPFFLTYFNTTGFCLWNAGYLLSPRWKRTPWDEEAREQPLCMEDARLEKRQRSTSRAGGARETYQGAQESSEDVQGGQRRLPFPSMQPADDRNSSHNVTLSAAVTSRSTLHDARRLPPQGLRHVSSALHPPPQQPQLPSGGRSTGAATAALQGSLQHHGSLPSVELAHVGSSGGRGGTGSLLGDNDDLDRESDPGDVSSAAVGRQLRMEDECRDYSLPTSCASSAREDVLSVMLTDEDDGDAPVPPAIGAAVDGGIEMPARPAPPREASRRTVVVSSELLQHDTLGLPHRRHVHQRARRPRVLRYSLRRIWTCALYFCPLWFLANYLFNLSLSTTSVASNTILSSTSSIWTLVLSYIMLRQKVGVHRIVAVALCVGGSIMVGLADKGTSGGHNTVGGDIIALLSAFFYAAYTSVLKWHLPDDERFAMGMVFGAVGVLNFFFLWPGLVFLSVTGLERFAWPTWKQFWPLLLNALIGTNLSDVLWARSVVLTSPVVATLGLSLTTPLAMIVDAIFKHAHFNGLYIAGAIMVMTGFLLANLPIRINLGV